MTITSSNIPLHACNVHVMGHVMDVITCITWWSLPLQSHYIQDVIHAITCQLHAPQDANACMGQQIHARVPFLTISFHLQGKNLPGGFNLILSHYILDAWGKNLGFKALDLCFVNTAL